MKITVKTTLLPAENRGTFITIDVTDASPTFGIKTAVQAEGCPPAVIDWGDGIQTGLDTLTHTYATPGRYTVAISDAIAELGVSTSSATTVYAATYAPMIAAVYSNAQKLTEVSPATFLNACNMTSFDMRETPIVKAVANILCQCSSLTDLSGLPSGITSVNTRSFYKCTGLTGRVDLPNLRSFTGGNVTNAPFAYCPGVTEIHILKVNEESVKASPSFPTAPTLGAVNATLFFDP